MKHHAGIRRSRRRNRCPGLTAFVLFAAGVALGAGTAPAEPFETPPSPTSEQLPGGGVLADRLPLPDWLGENLRLTLDLATRVDFSEEQEQFSFRQFIGIDLHKVISGPRGDIGTLIVQIYGTRIDNVEPTPPIFEDDHDWEAVYRIVNFNYTGLAAGRLNLRIGHFEIPFGLEYSAVTNGTLRQYLAPRNLGLKADWGVSLNGVIDAFQYEFALTRGSGNTYQDNHDPYTLSGRVGRIGPRSDIGASGYYAQLTNPGGTSERWRVALDGQLYEGAFGVMAELGFGETDARGVSNNLIEVNWVNPDETVTLYLQARVLAQEFARRWDEAASGALGVRWAPDNLWALSAQFSQDIEPFARNRRDSRISLQLRLRL